VEAKGEQVKKYLLATAFLAVAAAVAVTPFSPSRPQFAAAQGPVTPTNATWREPLSRDAKAAADKLGLIRIGSGLTIDGSGVVSASGGGGASVSIFRPSAYGTAGPAATAAQNTTAIQAAIDAAAAATSTTAVLLDTPGVWTVNAAGGTPARCFTLAANSSILVAPGVTIRLANNQATNAAPVSIFYQPSTATNCYVGWPSGGNGSTAGAIDGNTTNQSGWTGGFNQTNGNHHILSQDGFNGLTVENIRLINCFSNPINSGGANTYGSCQNFTARSVFCDNFGEGIQVIGCDNVDITNCTHIASTNINGDGLELSHCRYFSIRGCVSRTPDGSTRTVGGAGIDLYASRFGQVDGCFVEGYVYPMQIDTNYSDTTKPPDWISVSNCQFKACNAWLTVTGGRVSFSRCRFDSGNNGSGPQLSNTATDGTPAVYSFDACEFTNRAAWTINGTLTIRMRNCSMADAAGSGSGFITASGAVTWDIEGLSATSVAAQPFLNFVSGTHTGRIVNLNIGAIRDGSGRPFTFGGGVDPSSLRIASGSATLLTHAGNDRTQLAGCELFWPTAGIAGTDLPKGTAEQTLRLDARFSAFTLTAGTRLKLLNNATSTTIPVGAAEGENFTILRYERTTDTWTEVQRVITNQSQNFVTVTRDWTVTSPAASATTYMGSWYPVGYASSLRSIETMNEPNGTTGVATIEVTRGFGNTLVVGIAAPAYGSASPIYAPGTYPIAAGEPIRVRVTTDGAWVHNGNTLTAVVTLWVRP
jgi:hypothetical protein